MKKDLFAAAAVILTLLAYSGCSSTDSASQSVPAETTTAVTTTAATTTKATETSAEDSSSEKEKEDKKDKDSSSKEKSDSKKDSSSKSDKSKKKKTSSTAKMELNGFTMTYNKSVWMNADEFDIKSGNMGEALVGENYESAYYYRAHSENLVKGILPTAVIDSRVEYDEYCKGHKMTEDIMKDYFMMSEYDEKNVKYFESGDTSWARVLNVPTVSEGQMAVTYANYIGLSQNGNVFYVTAMSYDADNEGIKDLEKNILKTAKVK